VERVRVEEDPGKRYRLGGSLKIKNPDYDTASGGMIGIHEGTGVRT
jgi:hypothetical protein